MNTSRWNRRAIKGTSLGTKRLPLYVEARQGIEEQLEPLSSCKNSDVTNVPP
ncbi:MAG: hypothetical protein Q8P51_17315 [Ignavibacteria bacterium]|nr:hypothetical protein [Ignavibacteria bacterium]